MFSGREMLIGSVLFILSFLLIYSIRSYRIGNPNAVSVESTQVLYIPGQLSLQELPAVLDSLDIAYNREHLIWTGRLHYWSRLHPGRYEIRENYSNRDFLRRLAFGLQDPVNVLVPAGTTEDRFVQRISGQLRFDAGDLEAAMKDSSLLAELAVKDIHLLGRMLPDTYQMFWTSSPEQFLRRMLSEFDRMVVRRYEERIEELDKTVDEIVTLASIIEWEANIDDEKPMVSGLYWNRLRRNWRLQADPTVNYALGERNRLIYSDYQVDHPYNTYRIHGLPPGPITNPSYSSIHAALYPAEHNYMFMVASPQGGHAFSRTYEEHRRKSRIWTTWLREQREIRRIREMEEAAAGDS